MRLGRETERGFTLIEVMVALVILAVVLLGLGAATGTLVSRVSNSGRKEVALELAQDRLTRIQIDPVYDSLEARYASTGDTVPGHPGYTMSTDIVHWGGSGQAEDYKVVTVQVDAPGLAGPVARTGTVGAP
jgi:prepilin-type N-terminal cleavage/methylation domain-containing protein